MATDKPQLKTYIDREYYEKFKIVSKKENRSISNMLQKIVIDEIEKYETSNGSINVNIQGDNNNVDIN